MRRMRKTNKALIPSRRSASNTALLIMTATAMALQPVVTGISLADENGPEASNRAAGNRFSTTRWERAPNSVRSVFHERASTEARAAVEAAGGPTESTTPTTTRGRASRIIRGTGRMFADPRFAGAIIVSDLANAGLEGNPDRASDTFAALGTPEFWAGIGMFNASMMAGNAVTGPAFKRLVGKVGTESILARGAGALKHNLVLAGALTVPRMVQVDFGGFSFSDGLGGDFSKLKEASINFRNDVDAQDVAITLGSFAVAQPIWSGIKRGLGFVGRKIGARLARTAVIKGALAVAPVPGSRVAAAALTVGEVALGIFDLAGLLITAHKIEAPVKDWNDNRRSVNAVTEATDSLMATAANGSKEEFDTALREASRAFGNHRDFLYIDAAIEDVEFVDRLSRNGETDENMNALSNRIMDDYGAWLALPGQTSLLLSEYERRIAHARETGDLSNIPGGDLDAFEAMYERYKERARDKIRDIYGAKRVDGDEFTPGSENFLPSRNRDEVFAQEIALYRRLLETATDPDIRDRLLAEIETLEAIREVEGRLRANILGISEEPTMARHGVKFDIDGSTLSAEELADIVAPKPGAEDALRSAFDDNASESPRRNKNSRRGNGASVAAPVVADPVIPTNQTPSNQATADEEPKPESPAIDPITGLPLDFMAPEPSGSSLPAPALPDRD